jgi:hypothetical protein
MQTDGESWLQIRCLYLLTYLLTELNPFLEAANCAATQELPSILRNPKVHNSPPLVPILSKIDPVHTIPSIFILSTHLRFGLHSGLFPSGFPTNILYAFLVSPIRSRCLLLLKFSFVQISGIRSAST